MCGRRVVEAAIQKKKKHDMPAYQIVKKEDCDAPLLRNVDCAIVLTMREGKKRGRRGGEAAREAGPLHRLCRETFVQLNEGFRGGGKPEWVTNSAHDLVHAYTHACEFAKGKGNVLILEDDAEIMPGATRDDFSIVDAFLSTHRFDAYSLGSFGARRPEGEHMRMRTGRIGSVACSQAIVWSPTARNRLLRTHGASIPHIDGHFMSILGRVHTYRYPLVVQRFPSTENMSNWCVACTPTLSGRARDTFAISLFRLVLRSLRLDRSLGGWNVIYAYHTHTWKSVFAVLGTHMRLGMNPSTLPTSVFRSMKPR